MSGPRVMRPKSIATVVPVFVLTGAGEVDAEALDGDVGLGHERLDLGDGADERRLADGVAAGDDDLHRHRQAGRGGGGPEGTRHRARHRRVESDGTDPLQQPFEQAHVAVLGAVLGLAHVHHLRRARGRRPAPGRRRPACVRRAESSATDIGVWHSSTIGGPPAWRCGPAARAAISARTGACSSKMPSDELVRPRVSTYGRTSVRVRDRPRRGSSCGSTSAVHRIADLRQRGLQLGDRARA